jgi:hypothetical protein
MTIAKGEMVGWGYVGRLAPIIDAEIEADAQIVGHQLFIHDGGILWEVGNSVKRKIHR